MENRLREAITQVQDFIANSRLVEFDSDARARNWVFVENCMRPLQMAFSNRGVERLRDEWTFRATVALFAVPEVSAQDQKVNEGQLADWQGVYDGGYRDLLIERDYIDVRKVISDVIAAIQASVTGDGPRAPTSCGELPGVEDYARHQSSLIYALNQNYGRNGVDVTGTLIVMINLNFLDLLDEWVTEQVHKVRSGLDDLADAAENLSTIYQGWYTFMSDHKLNDEQSLLNAEAREVLTRVNQVLSPEDHVTVPPMDGAAAAEGAASAPAALVGTLSAATKPNDMDQNAHSKLELEVKNLENRINTGAHDSIVEAAAQLQSTIDPLGTARIEMIGGEPYVYEEDYWLNRATNVLVLVSEHIKNLSNDAAESLEGAARAAAAGSSVAAPALGSQEGDKRKGEGPPPPTI